MYAITKTEKNRTKIPNKLKATLLFSQLSFEGILSSLSSLKCLWISVEKSKESVGIENCFFDIETDKDVDEGFVEYFLGEPIKKTSNEYRISYCYV